ncbi:hypothetical protein KKJ09_18470 [Xenorhabdus bovienii]|uniref:hypothetical protein n=2 Tax=Xenorhabdus bovienii TaxID=40576 RepID=UPI0023B2FAB6|nr:hypothetical protein [Xenorhabdus bovienii]MDE9495515.1 hypothetical protein [Xenorhabdus bovienii]MDE9503939.1 hypothetical protein [Xenorhabdus bovienii]MDE9526743.1 hypothetical protein [Xenorhabdus bovienii]MDE9570353.1 hypothetical protein [Xenorhabdus bovienii]
MATYSMSNLFGLSRFKHKADHKDTTTAADFSHLSARADDSGHYTTEPAQELATDLITEQDEQPTAPKKHSRGHNVAVSKEAENSPVLAAKLLRDTDLSSKKIKAKLQNEPEALSKFTGKYMEEHDPSWEFLDDEEKALKAMTFAVNNNDANGYREAKDHAIKALKKMVEPMTEAEIQALIAHTRQTMNESNPNTPDNITARKKADEEYQDVVAKAGEKLKATYAKTGITQPDYSNR